MIKSSKLITLAETRELLKKIETDKAKAVSDFIRRFTKISAADALELKKALEACDIAKLKEEDMIKIINFMPTDAEDIRKIFVTSELSLDQDEITKVLNALKKK